MEMRNLTTMRKQLLTDDDVSFCPCCDKGIFSPLHRPRRLVHGESFPIQPLDQPAHSPRKHIVVLVERDIPIILGMHQRQPEPTAPRLDHACEAAKPDSTLPLVDDALHDLPQQPWRESKGCQYRNVPGDGVPTQHGWQAAEAGHEHDTSKVDAVLGE